MIKATATAQFQIEPPGGSNDGESSNDYPPDGQGKLWRNRLKAALGTTSGDFVHATLAQFQPASRLPSGGISEMCVNAVLAFIEALPTFERPHHWR